MTDTPTSSSSSGVRSIYERMTNPTPDDMSGSARVATMRRDQIVMIIDKVLLESLRHLERERDDVHVAITADDSGKGWSVRIDVG